MPVGDFTKANGERDIFVEHYNNKDHAEDTWRPGRCACVHVGWRNIYRVTSAFAYHLRPPREAHVRVFLSRP